VTPAAIEDSYCSPTQGYRIATVRRSDQDALRRSRNPHGKDSDSDSDNVVEWRRALAMKCAKLLAPGEAVRLAAREPREREAASAPQLWRRFGPELRQREAADLNAFHGTHQALRVCRSRSPEALPRIRNRTRRPRRSASTRRIEKRWGGAELRR